MLEQDQSAVLQEELSCASLHTLCCENAIADIARLVTWQAVVIGGGYIGLETTAGLVVNDFKVSICQ